MLDKAQLNARRIGANFLNGIVESTVAPINYLNNKLGITDDKETARINAKINSGQGIDLGLPKSFVDEGSGTGGVGNRISNMVSGLAKMAPAIIGAESSGGGSFFLQGTGNAALQVAKMKEQGIKFNNHSDDLYVLGSGIINYALGKSVSGTVLDKLAPGLQNDIVGGLAADATKNLANLGADATAQDVASVYQQTATNFSQKLAQYGLGILKAYPKIATDFAGANLLSSGLKTGVNALSGNQPMPGVTGDEIVKDVTSPIYNGDTPANGDLGQFVNNLITSPAAGLSMLHGAATAGMLFDKSPLANPIIESLKADNSPENVQNIQSQIAKMGLQKGWTDDEINNTVHGINKLSDIVNTLPPDLPQSKFHDAVTIIMDRGKLQGTLDEINARKANYDSAISAKAGPFEEMVKAQVDKLNDNLVDLFTDEKTKFYEKDGEYFKEHGYGDPEKITKARYDLENLENQSKPAEQQSEVKPDVENQEPEVHTQPVKPDVTAPATEDNQPKAAPFTGAEQPVVAQPAAPVSNNNNSALDDLDAELDNFKQSKEEPSNAVPVESPAEVRVRNTPDVGAESSTPDTKPEGPTGTQGKRPEVQGNEKANGPSNGNEKQITDEQTVKNTQPETAPLKQPEPTTTEAKKEAPAAANEPTGADKVELTGEKLEGRIESKEIQLKNLQEARAPLKKQDAIDIADLAINKAENELNELKRQRPYYVSLPNGHRETLGKPVPNDHGLDLFSHNLEDINGKGYGVSEGSTGLSIAKGVTEADAIKNAKELLKTKTPDEIQAIIKKQHENGLKSPRGIIKPEITDTENTEAVITKATASVRKAKATKRGSAESAGVIDDIDKALDDLDKEILTLGGNIDDMPPPEPEPTEPPPVDKKAEREAKKAKVKEKLDQAKKEFFDSVRKFTNAGIHPDTLAKGLKMMKAYAEAGILKFSEIAEDLADEIGEGLRDMFDALKASYLAYGAEATDEEADQMETTKEVRKANIDDFIPKKENNDTGSKSNTVDENTSAVDAGKPAGGPAGDVQQRAATELPATENGGSGTTGSKVEAKRDEPAGIGQPGSGDDTGTGSGRAGRGRTKPDNGSAVPADAKKRVIAPEDENHIIKPGDVIVPSGAVGKFNANVDALFLLKKLEAESRNPTPDEKKQLAQFVGWGGLAKYLNAADYRDVDAINSVMNGKQVEVYNSNYQRTRLNFTAEGPVDISKYSSMGDLVDHVKKQLTQAGYSISPDAIRAPLLKNLLSNAEYQDAQKSTVTAYYTEQKVISSMWNIVKQLGFIGGRATESSAGIGHILGMIPAELRNKTALTAFELDNVTGRILKKLYPQANITVGGFESARTPQNSQDLVITNVPFGPTAPYDRNFPELSKFSLHNYFIAKNLKLLKPGGIGMIITSSSTMDSPASAKFREWVTAPDGGNSYLVGAIRLPNNVFDDNAGTQVTSDIMVFQKKGQTTDSSLDQSFRYAKNLKDGLNMHGETVPIDVNEYYHEHPDNMLGDMMTVHEAGSGNRYGDGSTPTLKAPADFDIQKALKRAEKSFPTKIVGDKAVQTEVQSEPITAIDKKEGSVFVKDNKIYKVQDGDGQPMTLDAKQTALAKSYVDLKEGLLNLINLEQSTVNAESNIDAQRKELNKDYDAFVKKYGNINSRATNFLSDDDIDFPIVSALENIARSIDDKGRIVQTITKGEILNKRINFPRTEPTSAADIKDAINISLNYRTGLDLGYMARMLGKDADEVKDQLLKDELAYENPDTGIQETPEEYLSGFVRDKLRKAEVAAVNDPAYKRNVAELKKVIPEDIPSSLISYSLGSAWIPGHVYESFANDLFNGANIGVKYLDKAGKFLINKGYNYNNAAINSTYAAGGINGLDLLEDTLNNKQAVVTDTVVDIDGNKRQVKNVEKTAAAQAMQATLQDKFEEYVRGNEGVQSETERIYNDVFNGQVLRSYRIPEFKNYPGASHTISLREHQKRAVSRGLSESTLFAHEVGSGKTYTIITTAMEMRRLGTARKPMIGVQNSTLGDFVADFKRLYPSAKILAPTEKEMAADGRKKLFAKIATGDWDAIILPHSQITMIPDDPERQKAYIREQIEEMKETMLSVEDKRESNKFKNEIKKLEEEINKIDGNPTAKGGKSVAKSIGKKSLSIEAQLNKVLDRKVDNILNFEQLGVDALLMDEAHKYKRLGFQTSMQNIKGIDTSRSQRSQSVLLKSRWIQEKTGGKNVNFYTGTPISNTMAEAWTMMKYLRPDILSHMGIEYFDQFAKTFGQVIPSLEQTGGGTFKIQSRFAKFQNLPEFINAFRAVTDVVLTDDVKEFQNTDTIPKLKDGKFSQVILPQSPELKKQIQEFKDTLEWFDKLSGKEKKENSHIPLVIYNKAKQASIDLRLLNPENVDSPLSKANQAVDIAYKKYKETMGTKGVQMIFSDMYQSPEPKNRYLDEDGMVVNPAFGKPRFNLFEDIKKKLIAKGVPADQIVIFTESKYDKAERKKAVFADANAGKIRFLLGSTERMGVGVNAQQKMTALHHLDAPARPMDFEQRNGRIIRQGNENKEVEVFTYGVEKTLDSAAFQRLATKQKFINKIMKGQNLERVTEDPADEAQMTFDEMMAHLSDSPYAMQKLMVDNKLQTERMKQQNFNQKLIKTNRELQDANNDLKRTKAQLGDQIKNAESVRKAFPDGNILSLKIHDQPEATEKFGEVADGYINKLLDKYENSPTHFAKGGFELNGERVELEVRNRQQISRETSLVVNSPELYYTMPGVGLLHDSNGWDIEIRSKSGTGLLASIRSQLDNVLVRPSRTQENINQTEKNIEQLKKDGTAKFDDTKMKSLEEESEALKQKMIDEGNKPKPDGDGPTGGQTTAEYIKDQSNIKPALDFLDGMKAKNDGRMMSTIVPIPPAVWNGAIDVMKGILKATNSTQKAIRVAAKYIIDRGGSEAQAKDFEATMAEKMANTTTGKKATVADTDESHTEEYMVKAAGDLQKKLDGLELSPDEKVFANLDIKDLTKKELNRYIEVAAVLSVDPQGVLTKDVNDLLERVNNRKNPKSGTSVPPPAEPPVNNDGGLPEDDEPKRRIPKKDKLPMDPNLIPEVKGDENGMDAKSNYSIIGNLKDIHVRNLEQLKKYGNDMADMTALRSMIQLASTKSQASVDIKLANDKISRLIGQDGYKALREALIESRLRGTRARWNRWADQIIHASDNDVDDFFEDGKQSPMYNIIKSLEGYEDDENPAQTVISLIENGDYDDAREYMRDMFANAANNVAYFDKLSNGKTFDDMVSGNQFKDAKFQEALQQYKQYLEKPFKESHETNDGIFSDALGPLETYYPLSPVGADAHKVAMPSNSKYTAPANINNKFTTGSADAYSSEIASLAKKLTASLKTNNKAAAIRAIEQAGLLAKVSADNTDQYIAINGQVYKATKVPISDARTIIAGNQVVHTPVRYVLIPDWLYKEVKPIIEGAGDQDTDHYTAVGHIMNATVNFMLGGPAEAVGHSYRLVSAIINSMPYMQEWAYQNGVLGHAAGLVLNIPMVKMAAAMGKVLFTSTNSDEFANDVHEMAKLGLIPEKTWTHTYSKQFAESMGVDPVQFPLPWRDLAAGNLKKAMKGKFLDFSPMLYGKNGIDLKARVVMYRLVKAMNPNATPEQFVKMASDMGQYTQSLQSRIEKFIKQNGLAPFATFSRAYYRAGLKNLVGATPLPLNSPFGKSTSEGDKTSAGKYAYYKFAQMISSGILGMVGFWYLTYHAITGHYPSQDKDAKLLKVPIPPDWKQNKTIRNFYYNERTKTWDDMSMGFANVVADRGLKAVGAYKGYETAKLGGTTGQTAEAMEIQAINTYLSQYTASPAVSIPFTGITGDAPYITALHDDRGKVSPSFLKKSLTTHAGLQIPANVGEGLLGINPMFETINPISGTLTDEYNADDYESGKFLKSILNIATPNLFTPHGDDVKKEAYIKKNEKAIETTAKKEHAKKH